MEQHPVPGPVLPLAVHPGADHGRAGQRAGGRQAGADAVGQVLGVGVGDDQRRHLLGAVAADVGADGVGHRVAGLGRAGVLVLPALLGPQLLGRSRVAPAEQAQRLLVGRVDLAAVDREPGRGDKALGGQPLDVVGDPAGAHGLGLAGVAQHPYRPARAGVDRGQDGFDLAGRGLGDLVQDHHRARRERPVGQVDPQPGDRPGVQAGAGQLGHRLGRGGHRHHRPAVPAAAWAAVWSMVVLPYPAGASTARRPPPSPASTSHRRHLVLPQPRRGRRAPPPGRRL